MAKKGKHIDWSLPASCVLDNGPEDIALWEWAIDVGPVVAADILGLHLRSVRNIIRLYQSDPGRGRRGRKQTQWGRPAADSVDDANDGEFLWEWARRVGVETAAQTLGLSTRNVRRALEVRVDDTGMRRNVSWDGPARVYFPEAPDGVTMREYAAGLDHEQVAAVLGIIPMAVKLAVHRTGKIVVPRVGRTMVTVSCTHCGKTRDVPDYLVANHKSGRFFCNKACSGQYKSAHGRVERPCATCGKPVTVKRSIASKFENSFCSKECRYAYLTGTGNPNGVGDDLCRASEERVDFMKWGGRQWAYQCLLRDEQTCRLCGRKQDDEVRMHIHHKLSFKEYKHFRCTPDNGMTVCVSCHNYLHSNAGELVRYRIEVDALKELTSNLRRPPRPTAPLIPISPLAEEAASS